MSRNDLNAALISPVTKAITSTVGKATEWLNKFGATIDFSLDQIQIFEGNELVIELMTPTDTPETLAFKDECTYTIKAIYSYSYNYSWFGQNKSGGETNQVHNLSSFTAKLYDHVTVNVTSSYMDDAALTDVKKSVMVNGESLYSEDDDVLDAYVDHDDGSFAEIVAQAPAAGKIATLTIGKFTKEFAAGEAISHKIEKLSGDDVVSIVYSTPDASTVKMDASTGIDGISGSVDYGSTGTFTITPRTTIKLSRILFKFLRIKPIISMA